MSFTHLRLSINLGSEPIQGSVGDGIGRPQEFHGWMELAELIEAVRSTASRLPQDRPNKD